jgi:CHAT domain-containing protein
VTRDYNLFSLQARILIELSILSGARGRMEASLTYLDQARALEDRLYSPTDKSGYLNRLGSALESLGRSTAAAAVLAESVELARAHRDPLLELDARLHIAAQMLASGVSEALDAYRSSYQQAVELDDGRGQGRALSGLGAAHERLGSYRRSLEYYQRSLELANRAGDRRAEATTLGNIGLVYFRLGQPSRALVYSARATQLASELKEIRLQAGLLNGLAASLAGLGRLQQSEQVYRRALDVVSGRPSPGLEGLILAGWARVMLALGKEQQALEGFERARVLARSGDNTLVRVQAHFGLGQCHARQENLEQATAHFEETLTLVESMRSNIPTHSERMSYLETRSEVYASLASVLLQRDRSHPGDDYREKAFQVVERSRARTLLDALSVSQAAETTTPAAKRDTRAPEILDSSRVRSQVLHPGEVLLEYTLGRSRSFLWALTRNDLQVFELPPRREIETLTRSFLQTIRTPPRAPMNLFESHLVPARELFEMLLGPVRDLLEGEPHLIIVPDGILHHLPFEALAEANGAERPRYLVEMATVSYVPSASVLGYLRQRPHKFERPLEFLGVAQPGGAESMESIGPDIALARLPPIPYSSQEVERVARLFPDARRRIYLGPAATESAVKALDLSRFRILHFAAHAVMDETFPERSALLLGAGSDGEDGLLQMGEVLELDLASDLVVLSGCQTGVGQLLRAEGTLGFTWAFLSAGSSEIVVSLWGVNDRSTSELMEMFYARMSQSRPRPVALREAKRSMLESERMAFRHPYFWAPFVLVGAGTGTS